MPKWKMKQRSDGVTLVRVTGADMVEAIDLAEDAIENAAPKVPTRIEIQKDTKGRRCYVSVGIADPPTAARHATDAADDPIEVVPVQGGLRYRVGTAAPDFVEGLEEAYQLLEKCPYDAYPWRVEIRRARNGGVAVRVTFQAYLSSYPAATRRKIRADLDARLLERIREVAANRQSAARPA
jgi:hypothetical protein